MSCKRRMEKKAGYAGIYFDVLFKHLAHVRIVPLCTVQVRYLAFLGVHARTHTHTQRRGLVTSKWPIVVACLPDVAQRCATWQQRPTSFCVGSVEW